MNPIEILMLEDSPRDAELNMRELQREGIQFDVKRVMTEPEFIAGLQNPALDLILADLDLPSYDGLSALTLARKLRPDVPFIFVSGTLGEELAVDAVHHGATDYVVKQRLKRLGPSVRRTLLAVQERKESAEKVKISEERLAQALEAGQMGAWAMDLIMGTSWRTSQHDQIFGYTTPLAEWNYDILLKHVVPEDLDLVKRAFAKALTTDGLSLECRIVRVGHEPRWIFLRGHVYRNEKGERVRLMGTVRDISERKLMEKVLRESERRFRLLADNANDLIWTTDVTGRLNYVSPSVQRLLGYTPAEILSRGMDQMLTAASATAIRKTLDEAIPKMQAGKHVRETIDLNYIRKDGWTVWCEVSCGGIFDSPGEFVGVVGVSRDINARKRAEESLRVSEERTRAIADSAQDAILMMDKEGRVSYWNPAAERIFGYTRAEAIGQNLHEFIVPARYHEAHHAAFPAFQRTGHGTAIGKTLDLEACRKDGKELSVQLSLSSIHMNDGWHAVGILRDITERKRVEEAHARLAAAVEQAVETIVITDVQGTILYTNPAFERITGYTHAEAIGQNPRVLKSGKHDAAFYRQMWDTLGRGEVWHGHFINKKKDGSLYEEDASITSIRDGKGTIVNYVAVKRDVTREAALEAQLRQSQKMEALGTLAGGVAHEINNPINGIMNYAQLITDRLPADSSLRTFATEIIKETDRVALIVRNLLAFAHKDKQSHQPASPKDIVGDAISLMRTMVRHDQVALTADVAEDLPKVNCRSQQIQQVVINLLTNARDALNEKYPGHNDDKIIRIVVRRIEKDGKPWIRMTVEDHGSGIPKEVGSRIFDPFFTTKQRRGGTGLGLSISHGIVKDHGGELHFETETGRYTRFHLDLPVNEENQV